MDEAPPRETELKFLVEPSRADELFRSLAPAAGPPKTLVSTYYDTPRRDLRKAGLTLRVRHDGERWVQTIKGRPSSDGGLGRDEWECEIASSEPDAGAAARTPAGKLVRNAEALAPVFTVAVNRRQTDMRQDGAVIEVSLDRGHV